MGHFLNPNILTVCNGARELPTLNHSVVSTVAGELIPRLTPQVGFEPTTNRLTVDGSAAELLRIVFFFFCFEVKFVIPFLHFFHGVHIFLKSHKFEMLICAFHLTNETKDIYWTLWTTTKFIFIEWFHKPRKRKRIRGLEPLTFSLEGWRSTTELHPHIGGPYTREEVVVVSLDAQRLR